MYTHTHLQKRPAVVPLIDNQNDDYEITVQQRQQDANKGHGDRVKVYTTPSSLFPYCMLSLPQVENRMGTIVGVMRDGSCKVKWDKKQQDREDVSTINSHECSLVAKAHPAAAVMASPPRKTALRAGEPSWRYKTQSVSVLSSLFSDPEAPLPDFLVSDDQSSRKQIVAQNQQARRTKMMHNQSRDRSFTEPSVQRSRRPVVQSKFRDKPPFASPGAQEVQISKEEGAQLGLIFDPETLCLLEAERDSPAEAFDKYRGMRITHVSTREEPQFSNDEGVHSGAQLRKALARAQESETVAVRFETWTQRRAVEKKKREFREKLIANRDKAIKDRATRD